MFGDDRMKIRETAPKYLADKKPFTYQDYLNLPDDGMRYEVINGELIMTPSPIVVHQKVSVAISSQLYRYVNAHNLGTVFTAPLDVVFGEKDVLQPDVLFISNGRKNIIKERNIAGAPDLIVEVLSPSTAYYDLFDKKELYEKFGVREYWIVDPMRQWVERYRLHEGKFVLAQRLEKQGHLSSDVLKGFKLNLEDVFKN